MSRPATAMEETRRVVVAWDRVAPGASPDAEDMLHNAGAIGAALRRQGWEVEELELDLDLSAAAARLRAVAPDLVFNLADSLGGLGRLVNVPADLYASLGLRHTGNPGSAMTLTTDKVLARRLMASAGIPIPPAFPGEGGEGPWIVKPACEDASVGITEASVTADPDRVRALLAANPGYFAETYVDGREVSLSLLGHGQRFRLLPPAEMVFVAWPADRPKVLSYEAKWTPGSFGYENMRRSFELPGAGPALLTRFQDIAARCWKLFGLRGYARIDLRIDAAGRPWVLEVNGNPCLDAEGGFMAAAAQAGLDFDTTVAWIVADALGEGPEVSFREEPLPGDVEAIRRILVSSGYFYPMEVDVAVELVEAALGRGAHDSGYHFLFAERDGRVVGYTCFGPISCTFGRYDLYWIGVEEGGRHGGLGTELLVRSEARIRALGGARVYAETSSRPLYEPTRAFYRRRGYAMVGEIPGFYGPGDGKVTFEKVLVEE